MQCPYLHRKRTGSANILQCGAGPGDGDIGSRCSNEGYNYCRLYLERSTAGRDDDGTGTTEEESNRESPTR